MTKKKKTNNTFSPMNVTTNVVGAGVGLGVGATTLGAMGQGAMVPQIITPAANMIGPYSTAAMGMGILGMMTKKKKK